MSPHPRPAAGPAVRHAAVQCALPGPRIGTLGRCTMAAGSALLAVLLLAASPRDAVAAGWVPVVHPEAGSLSVAGVWAAEAGAPLAATELAPPRMAGWAGSPVVLGVSVERPRGLDSTARTGAGWATPQRPVVWAGLRRQASPSTSLTWQVPLGAEGGAPWRLADAQDAARRSEISLGLQLKSPKSGATGLRGALRMDISAQTYVLLKPRKGRVAVVLSSTW